ncbi:MAG TPA: PP2C family serine/threonine-protein phosphatase [Burkholderiaceae bacterium]|nr:PP2C family serine/threonine-protein phosphatase [Burkholderiaceae bacterium]
MSAIQSDAAEFALAACTAQDRGGRAEQQDRVAILRSRRLPRAALGLLADGLGGRSGGALAAEQTVMVAQRLFDGFGAGDPVAEFFEDLVTEVHTVIRLSAMTIALEPHTTLAAVLLQPGRVDWCHVGDSRIYHFRGNRVAHRSCDDTYAAQLVAEGRLKPDKARLHPSAGLLTQALGGQRRPHPTLGGVREPDIRDRFALCSDGLWAHVSDAEMAGFVDSLPPRQAAEQLLTLAAERARGQGDNCSIVLFRLEPAA